MRAFAVRSLMEDHLSIVLLGKAGAGKSSSGNTILGRAVFESKLSFRPVTRLTSVESGTVFGKQISVIDTPEILGSERQVQTFCQCVLQDSSPVLFLLVIRVGRFTEEDYRAVDAASRVIGAHRLEKCYLLFTGGDELKMSVDDYILKDKKSSLPVVVEKFSRRIHLFNNKDGGQEQVRELLMEMGAFSGDVKSSLTRYRERLRLKYKQEGWTSKKDEKNLDDIYTKLYITSNVSLKDIISNSFLISSGPPAVYQLRAKKQKFGTVTRMTVGEKIPNKTNRTILLVGETGGGKSTLINALLNYTMGVKWEDRVWFMIVEEERRSQTETQTSDVIVYEIFGFEDKTLPYSLTIIDTPGYGNTRGIECDDIISCRLLDLFRSDDGVHEVHAVGLVMNTFDNRLSDRLMYIFDSVMSLFGKNMEKNIVALITHSNGRRPKILFEALEAANIECAKNEKNKPVYFLFNNCQLEEEMEENTFLKHSWESTQKTIDHFTDFLEKSNPQKLMTTVEVLIERIRLRACIQNLKERIELGEKKQREIRQIRAALKKHEEEMKRNERFTVEVDEPYKVKDPIDGGMRLFFYEAAVCCTACEENCHYPCTMVWNPENCEVMKGGRCTVCTNKCPASDHVKEKWRYAIKTRRVRKVNEEMKLKFEKNKTESKIMLSLLENLEKEINQLTAEKPQWLNESYQHVVRLEQIALKADSASTIVHLDFLIEKMMENGETEKVQKLEEMRSRVDEGTRAAYWYKLKYQAVV